MAQYTATVSWDAVAAQFQAAGSLTTPNALALGMAFGFTNSGGSVNTFRLEMGMYIPFAFAGNWRAYQTDPANGLFAADYDLSFHAPAAATTYEGTDPNAGTEFLSGGTLTAIVDDGAQTIEVAGPIGIHFYSFAALGLPAGSISGFHLTALMMGLVIESGSNPVNWVYPAGFFNYFAKDGSGTVLDGGALGNNWPAAFLPGDLGLDPFTESGEPATDATAFVSATAVRLIPQYTVGPNGTFAFPAQMTAISGQSDAELTDAGLVAPLYGARAVEAANNPLFFRRSFDGGLTWQESIAVPANANATYRHPALVSRFGVLWLVYEDNSRAKLLASTLSRDYGQTWSNPGDFMPMTLAGSGQFPRLVWAPEGTLYFFYLNSGQIWLQRSFDLGNSLADPAAIVVATGVPLQSFGACTRPDKSLRVAWAAGNTWNVRLSRDFGSTWSST